MYSEYALAPPAVSDSDVAFAGLLRSDPGTWDDPWYHRSLPCPDWSRTAVITHEAPAQNASCAAASAIPPGDSTPMSRVMLSEERLTWYSGPRYEPNSARTVLCAATQ